MELDEELKVEFAINNAGEAIVTGNMQLLEYILDTIPLDNVKEETSIKLLILFLNLSLQYSRRDMGNFILEYWSRHNLNERTQPTRTALYTMRTVSTDILKYFDKDHEGSSFTTHATNLMNFKPSADITLALERLAVVFGKPSEPELRTVLNALESILDITSTTNEQLYNWVVESLQDVSEYAPIPQWIVVDEPLRSHDELVDSLPIPATKPVFEIPDNEEIASTITDFIGIVADKTSVVRDAILESVTQSISKMTVEEKRDLLLPHIRMKNEYMTYADPNVFKVLGPAHPLLETTKLDSTSRVPCYRWGGCRMMTCYEFENFDELTGEVIDEDIDEDERFDLVEWFRGSCDKCLKKIREKHHAVRMPLVGGGWIGCYCSWKCVRDDVVRPNPLQVQIVNEFEDATLRYGIIDRVWTSPPTASITSSDTAYELKEEIERQSKTPINTFSSRVMRGETLEDVFTEEDMYSPLSHMSSRTSPRTTLMEEAVEEVRESVSSMGLGTPVVRISKLPVSTPKSKPLKRKNFQ